MISTVTQFSTKNAWININNCSNLRFKLVNFVKFGIQLKCGSRNRRYKSNSCKNPRQHVNPLRPFFQKPIELEEDWIENHFQMFRNPLIVDIGCGKGVWVNDMSNKCPEFNHLGIDIRPTVIDIANQRYVNKVKRNIHFICGNANVNMERILSDITSRRIPLHTLCVQFPDPHFKKKHHKRRLVNQEFISILAKYMYKHDMYMNAHHSISTSKVLEPPNLVGEHPHDVANVGNPQSGNQRKCHLFIQTDVMDVMEDILGHISYFNEVSMNKRGSVHLSNCSSTDSVVPPGIRLVPVSTPIKNHFQKNIIQSVEATNVKSKLNPCLNSLGVAVESLQFHPNPFVPTEREAVIQRCIKECNMKLDPKVGSNSNVDCGTDLVSVSDIGTVKTESVYNKTPLAIYRILLELDCKIL